MRSASRARGRAASRRCSGPCAARRGSPARGRGWARPAACRRSRAPAAVRSSPTRGSRSSHAELVELETDSCRFAHIVVPSTGRLRSQDARGRHDGVIDEGGNHVRRVIMLALAVAFFALAGSAGAVGKLTGGDSVDVRPVQRQPRGVRLDQPHRLPVRSPDQHVRRQRQHRRRYVHGRGLPDAVPRRPERAGSLPREDRPDRERRRRGRQAGRRAGRRAERDRLRHPQARRLCELPRLPLWRRRSSLQRRDELRHALHRLRFAASHADRDRRRVDAAALESHTGVPAHPARRGGVRRSTSSTTRAPTPARTTSGSRSSTTSRSTASASAAAAASARTVSSRRRPRKRPPPSGSAGSSGHAGRSARQSGGSGGAPAAPCGTVVAAAATRKVVMA